MSSGTSPSRYQVVGSSALTYQSNFPSSGSKSITKSIGTPSPTTILGKQKGEMPTDLLDKSLKILAKEMRTTKPFMDHLVAKKAPQTSRESPTISQADHSARRCVEVYLSPIASGRGRSSLNWKKGTYVNLLRHEL